MRSATGSGRSPAGSARRRCTTRHCSRSGALLESARIELDEAGRALRNYRDRLDLDPAELAATKSAWPRCTTSRASIASAPTTLPELLAQTEARLALLPESADAAALARRAAQAEATTARSRASCRPSASSPPASSTTASAR